MIKPVEHSELAEQIELARKSIDRWPEWLKDAAGIGATKPDDTTPVHSANRTQPSTSELTD
jgi:hypothetical protein